MDPKIDSTPKQFCLSNRSAQAAGPGYVSFSVRGWTQRVREAIQTYTQEVGKRYRKIAKSIPESAEKVTKSRTKSTQNGPKTKPRGARSQSSLSKMPWKASGGRFHRYPAPAEGQLGGQNRRKTVKKQYKKSLNFWSHLWCEKSSKMVPKILKNRSQNCPKSDSEGSRNKKQEKCKNEQPSIVFGTFLLSAGVENPTKFFKKWCRKRDQNQVRFWSRFFEDFGGFWSHLGSQNRPKMDEKRHQKTERFLDEAGRPDDHQKQ